MISSPSSSSSSSSSSPLSSLQLYGLTTPSSPPSPPPSLSSSLLSTSSYEKIAVDVIEVLKKARAKVIAPVLWTAVVVCLVMSVMLFIDVVLLGVVSLFLKLFRPAPQRKYRWDDATPTASLSKDTTATAGGCEDQIVVVDLEDGSSSDAFPLVLVQIPMFNEKEVYKLSIGAACSLRWPSDRIVIQVLDDSTDTTVKGLVQSECSRWAGKGVNIRYKVRDGRKGYKAGALREGMACAYASKCEFVAIFDSDFQPHPDFLTQTVPFLTADPCIALVQARWDFVNAGECVLTRMQKMTLDYHFKVEQEAGSSTCGFFGFNGTAGVWRVSALNEAGGWNDRTTVEDMDLAVRATLRGWKFVYAGDVKVKSELPSNFQAYRNQQRRWTCGAANLFRKMGMEIIASKNVPLLKKAYLIYSFFLVRKVVAHIVTFVFYSVVIPLSVFVPEVEIPTWGMVYAPTAITILNAIRNPSCLHLLVFWIVFENAISFHRMKATVSGLFEAGSTNDWIVTEKLGEALLAKPRSAREQGKPSIRFRQRIYLPEIGIGIFLLACATYNLVCDKNYYYVYIYLQAIAFLIVGFGYIGT